MDPTVQEALLQDPRVREAIKSAGQDALANPEVQKQIMEACKQRFPEIAAAAQAKVLEWARDPEVQRQAYACAGLAAEYTQHAVGQVSNLIEQGPAGLRVIAFAGGVASSVNAILFMFGVLNPASAVTQMDLYVVHGYLVAFAMTTMLFEAKPEWIEMVSGLNMYQNMLLEKAQFLSEVLGRGLFYGFQGTLWLSFASFSALQNYILGLLLLVVAMFHIFMHFGVMPHEVVSKFRLRDPGYVPVSREEEPLLDSHQDLVSAEPQPQHHQSATSALEVEAVAAEPVASRRSEQSSGSKKKKHSTTNSERASKAASSSNQAASSNDAGWLRSPPVDETDQRLLDALKVPQEPFPTYNKEAENAAPEHAPFGDKKNRQTKELGLHVEEADDTEATDIKKKNCCSLQ